MVANTAIDGSISYESASLTTLIDSPVLAGEHFRTELLESGERPTIVSIAADSTSALKVPAERFGYYRSLSREAQALFGARHYRSYHWLIALGDSLDENGLEHHESTDIRGPLSYFTNPTTLAALEFTLPHEYAHSWNGKYRRPAGMTPRDPQQALNSELLWVYEGFTRYLDLLLTARSQMRTPEMSRNYLAWRAARQDRTRQGRSWRPLVDTAISAQELASAPDEWTAYRRSQKDYYDEAMLIWLEADTLIREKSSGRRSIDDFCRAFFGGSDGPPTVKTFTREDLEAALGEILPFDWHSFFTSRVYEIALHPPLDGLAQAGWKLVYDAQLNEFQQAWDTTYNQLDHTFSIGLLLDLNGFVKDVAPDTPAWKGEFCPGMKILSINGQAWSPAVFGSELRATKLNVLPLSFSVLHGDTPKILRVDWHGGVLYPHLERDTSRPDMLAKILAPRTLPLP
jgi:predicted metalloprotease with PDZ domain